MNELAWIVFGTAAAFGLGGYGLYWRRKYIDTKHALEKNRTQFKNFRDTITEVGEIMLGKPSSERK